MASFEAANERISSAERDGAISSLSAHRDAGRLDSGQFEARQVAATSAQTWADLLPLFADLPEPRPAKITALAAYAPPGTRAPAPGGGVSGAVVRPGGPSWGLPDRARETIMALTPFVALVLFFTTHTWLWFLGIPVMGILLYGPEGRRGRGRGPR
jgi:hypothetical protein